MHRHLHIGTRRCASSPPPPSMAFVCSPAVYIYSGFHFVISMLRQHRPILVISLSIACHVSIVRFLALAHRQRLLWPLAHSSMHQWMHLQRFDGCRYGIVVVVWLIIRLFLPRLRQPHLRSSNPFRYKKLALWNIAFICQKNSFLFFWLAKNPKPHGCLCGPEGFMRDNTRWWNPPHRTLFGGCYIKYDSKLQEIRLICKSLSSENHFPHRWYGFWSSSRFGQSKNWRRIKKEEKRRREEAGAPQFILCDNVGRFFSVHPFHLFKLHRRAADCGGVGVSHGEPTSMPLCTFIYLFFLL